MSKKAAEKPKESSWWENLFKMLKLAVEVKPCEVCGKETSQTDFLGTHVHENCLLKIQAEAEVRTQLEDHHRGQIELIKQALREYDEEKKKKH